MPKNKKKSTKESELNEPSASYENNRLRIFKSFEEENEFTYSQMAKVSGLDNFISVTNLVSKLFVKELELNPTSGNRIYFD